MAKRRFNKLTPGEEERLAILSEGCAEVIQAVCKIQRHGYESRNPLARHAGTNREMLADEIGYVLAAIDRLQSAVDVHGLRITQSKTRKKRTIKRWLHHQPEKGKNGN